jgi:ABC-type lipoprotein export system ATPase subunit
MKYRGDNRGALWRKWDLHVHTPASYAQDFGDRENAEVWDRYIAALAGLSPEIEVVGINDYYSITGYQRVYEAWLAGRLPNLKLVLPIVEVRLDHLAGNSDTQRVNFHILFSNEIDPVEIERSFLNQLRVTFANFNGSIGHPEGMAAYGNAIKAASPPDRQPKGSDQRVGFEHSFVSLGSVLKALELSAFRKLTLCALGYTEWNSMRWTGGGGAIKKHITEHAHFFFGNSALPADHLSHQTKLREFGFAHPLLDASDAHRFSDDPATDRRLGATMTWIKADPTFEGLQRAVHRAEERIYIGDEPPQRRQVRTQPNRFIRSIAINQKPGVELDDVWFNSTIAINPGLVAIIGNQGSGKSALTDCIALSGHAEQPQFSFLNDRRFRKPSANKAKYFETTIVWEDGESEKHNLDGSDHVDRPERVRYVPQHFFELATNEVDVSGEGLLYTEIEKAVFSHIPAAQRQKCGSFRDLISERTASIDAELLHLRAQLSEINVQVVELESETSAAHRNALAERLAFRKHLATQAESAPPLEVSPPEADADLQALEQLRFKLSAASKEIAEAQRLETVEFDVRQALSSAKDSLIRAKLELERRREEASRRLSGILSDFDLSALLTVTINTEPLDSRIAQIEDSIQKLRELQDPNHEGSPAQVMRKLQVQLEERTRSLGEAQRSYETYKTEYQAWEERLWRLSHDPEDPDALESLECAIQRLETDIPQSLRQLRSDRLELVRHIHAALNRKLAAYRDLAEHVQAFLRHEEVTRDHYRVEFDLELIPIDLPKSLFSIVKHQGPFSRTDAAQTWVKEKVIECSLSEVEQLIRMSENVCEKVVEGKNGDADRWEAGQQMLRSGRKFEEVYDLLFGLSYISPRYRLTLKGQPIEQVSPGERGILLLIFYLIVDKSDLPLVIDQPEGNLNNQSIYEHLVPVFKKAKGKRQIIMVSHNPNIVVGCDADQIVHAQLEQMPHFEFKYTTGAIENPEFREFTVDKLEGTRPAFAERAEAYRI